MSPAHILKKHHLQKNNEGEFFRQKFKIIKLASILKKMRRNKKTCVNFEKLFFEIA